MTQKKWKWYLCNKVLDNVHAFLPSAFKPSKLQEKIKENRLENIKNDCYQTQLSNAKLRIAWTKLYYFWLLQYSIHDPTLSLQHTNSEYLWCVLSVWSTLKLMTKLIAPLANLHTPIQLIRVYFFFFLRIHTHIYTQAYSNNLHVYICIFKYFIHRQTFYMNRISIPYFLSDINTSLKSYCK